MKKTKLIFVLLASLVLGACGSSSDDDGGNNSGKNAAYTETSLSEAPVWQIDWNNNQGRPNWSNQDISQDYGNFTILKVQLEDALRPYVSEDDMLALFIDGELRGLTHPAVIVGSDEMLDDGKFVMKAWGDESASETVTMSLQYYSQTLKHIFTLTGDITLDPDETTGIDEDYIPEFTLGSAKYPVMKSVMVESILNKVGIIPVSGNTLAAFVGSECRGTTTLSVNGGTSLLIFGRNTGESVTLKYFDTATMTLYTIPDIVKL
ncbi:MAG: hypothetical protein J6T38_05795 [Bacteroidaceae bacterium]|nr:hypothetical protein [Bacteroidaceae bacterium]